MRLTINDRVLDGGYGSQLLASEWWLLQDGLEGWYSAPPPRASAEPVPDGHGGYWPSRFLMGSRILTLRGAHIARTSSLARAEAEDWVASLDGELTITVEDEHGAREVTGFLSAAPSYEQWDEESAEFALFVTCPDPIKYGPAATFDGSKIENAGGTAVLPWRIVTTGPATSILVVIDGHRIRWTGTATDVVIDTRSGTVTAAEGDVTTGLIEDDVPEITPGKHPLTITTNAASCEVEVRPGWR